MKRRLHLEEAYESSKRVYIVVYTNPYTVSVLHAYSNVEGDGRS